MVDDDPHPLDLRPGQLARTRCQLLGELRRDVRRRGGGGRWDKVGFVFIAGACSATGSSLNYGWSIPCRGRSSSARRAASRARIASRPSPTAARMSAPKPRSAPARSEPTRSGVYRSTVSLTTRVSQNDMPNPKDAPTISQRSRLNMGSGLPVPTPPAHATGHPGRTRTERERLDDRVGEGEVSQPGRRVDGGGDRLGGAEEGVHPLELAVGLPDC